MKTEALHLGFWGLALALLTAVAVSTLLGWREIRRGEVARHQRWMNLAGGLVGLFLALYVVKVLTLGREDLAGWNPASLAVLYTHEAFVALMMVATSGARWISRYLRRPAPPAHLRRLHRWLGRLGAVASLLALLSAMLLFREMVERAGT